MNVQPSDLARIVGQPQNAMAIVKVLFLVPEGRGSATLVRPAWVCECLSPVRDRADRVAFAGHQVLIADRALRPWYDGDEPDESLSWSKPIPSHSEAR